MNEEAIKPDEKLVGIGMECEKADLEACEKERADNKLTLPLPSTSVNTSSVGLNPSPTTSPLVLCAFKEECDSFKKKLILPGDDKSIVHRLQTNIVKSVSDIYFSSNESICYCSNCCRWAQNEQKDSKEQKDALPLGWVRYPLKNLTTINTDKWETAFYPTKVGTVRSILDLGQPLTKGE